MEFQLAQAFLNTKTQFSHDPASFEASKSAHDCNVLADSYLKNGTPETQVFCFKTHEASIKTHETNLKNTNLKSIQRQRKAETHFTAFSPTFQIPAKPDIFSSNQNRSFTKAKPPQMPSKMDTYNLPINNFNSSSAHNQAKTSEKSSKAVHQNQSLSAGNFASNQSPPPPKQGQNFRFSSQIKQTTSANLILATAAPISKLSSPVFISSIQNSPLNSSCETNFAVFPAAPAAATLYDVVSTTNVPDYKVLPRGDVGDAANRYTDMRGLANPSVCSTPLFPSMERTFSTDLQHMRAPAAISMPQIQLSAPPTPRSAPGMSTDILQSPIKAITSELQCETTTEIIKLKTPSSVNSNPPTVVSQEAENKKSYSKIQLQKLKPSSANLTADSSIELPNTTTQKNPKPLATIYRNMDSPDQIKLKREQRAHKNSQAIQETLRVQSLTPEEKFYEEFRKFQIDIAKFHGTPLQSEELLRKQSQEAFERQKLQELEDEQERNEVRQELLEILLTDPKLRKDLNIEEQRFYYKAFNHHLSNDEIESKSSEEMLAFLHKQLARNSAEQACCKNSF